MGTFLATMFVILARGTLFNELGIITTSKIYMLIVNIYFIFSIVNRIIRVKNKKCDSILNIGYGYHTDPSIPLLFLTLDSNSILITSTLYAIRFYMVGFDVYIVCLAIFVLVLVKYFNWCTDNMFDNERSCYILVPTYCYETAMRDINFAGYQKLV